MGRARESEIFLSFFSFPFFFSFFFFFLWRWQQSIGPSFSLAFRSLSALRFPRRTEKTYRSHRAAAGGQGWTCTGGRAEKEEFGFFSQKANDEETKKREESEKKLVKGVKLVLFFLHAGAKTSRSPAPRARVAPCISLSRVLWETGLTSSSSLSKKRRGRRCSGRLNLS